jgi:hypothetical protein
MQLNEGGNIWDDVVTGFDPSVIAKPLEDVTQKYLNDVGVEVYVVGSGYEPRKDAQGNPVPSNDLDVMIDLPISMQHFGTKDSSTTRKALAAHLNQQGIETKLAGVTVHSRIPLGNKFYQVDIKVVNNAAKVAQFHRHEIPQGSPYKGVNKQMIMNTLATSKNMLWSPDEGLYARDVAGKKANLLSDEWDTIAQYLLGKGATGKDLGSVESIMAKIPDGAAKDEILAKAKASSSWQAATPTVQEGSREWFRFLMDHIL